MSQNADIREPNQGQGDQEPPPGTEQAHPLSFDDLAGGKKEVQIEYRGQIYRLRATRNGGLILNK
jgi:hemin uptake protein HemP